MKNRHAASEMNSVRGGELGGWGGELRLVAAPPDMMDALKKLITIQKGAQGMNLLGHLYSVVHGAQESMKYRLLCQSEEK